MIAEKTESPVQILQERILKLEQELARMQAELQGVKSSVAEITPAARKQVSFDDAAEGVLAGYSDLLQRLSQ